MDAQRTCPTCGKTLDPTAPQGLCPACLLAAGFATDANTANAGSSRPAATRFIAPRPEELATLFPQLEILSLLGQGGMGAVYRARQPSLDRLVALKILPPSSERDAAFEERFTREARALARLQHPNIVAVHDFGTAGGYHYFIMEFVDGVTLRHVLATTHTTPREALAIVPQICDALQYAHDKGIVHRDIKPENILIDKTGAVKIADFGLAKLVGAESPDLAVTGARDVMGTPHYMAPEQVEHPLEVDHRADIYSLGVVFYQMLTGELPLGRFAPPSRKVQVDVRLDDVVLRALEKEPELRYQQASGLRTAVETLMTTETPESRPANETRLWRRRPALGITIAACVMIATIAGFGLWRPPSPAMQPRPAAATASNPPAIPSAPARSVTRVPASAQNQTPTPAQPDVGAPRVRSGNPDLSRESDASLGAQQRAHPARPEMRVTEPAPVPPATETGPIQESVPTTPAGVVNRGHYALTRAPADYDAMESNPEILRIQLRQAEVEKEDVSNRARLGVATLADIQRAEERTELFRARLEGDRVRFARVKLAAASQRLDEATARYNVGLASGMDMQIARDDVHIEQARLREAETRANREAARADSAPPR